MRNIEYIFVKFNSAIFLLYTCTYNTSHVLAFCCVWYTQELCYLQTFYISHVSVISLMV